MANSVDVLICTHNEAPHIGRVLESLEQQTAGSRSFRTIVVDNASDDGTAELVDSYTGRLDLVYVLEQQLGLNYARNSGYRISRADYVAHIDADAKAHPEWIEQIIRVLAEVQPDLCGGPYFPYYLQPKPAWFDDRYNSNYLGRSPRYLAGDEYLSGTNMIWRHRVVTELGGFNYKHGLVGRGLIRGDETELIVRARREIPTFTAYYDPAIVVYHLTRAVTFSLRYWLRRSFVYGVNQEAALIGNPPGRLIEDAKLIRWILSSLAKLALGPLMGTILRDRHKYPHVENYLYERMMPQVATFGRAYARWLGYGERLR